MPRSSTPSLRPIALALGLAAALMSTAATAGPKIAVDVASGRVIAHEDAFKRWYPASLTKLMTTYVVFDALRSGRITLESAVTMSATAAKEPASKMYFNPGAQFTIDSAIKYLMVKSANDVAVAIAETVAGDTATFVEMMNTEALRIGMTASRFINPHGLPGAGQYTTAHDMAVLAVALRREFPEYASYFGLEGFRMGKGEHHNYNILLGRFEGADGMKTGFICASGFNLAASATIDGKTVIAIVLGAASQEQRAEDAAGLLHRALTETPTQPPQLSSLAPYGADRDALADISTTICSEQARVARYEGRDVEGKMVLRSPYIGELTREPRLVPAPVGVPGGAIALSRIPVPTPRPDRLAGEPPVSAIAGSSAEVSPLRGGLPVPSLKPTL